MSIPVDVFENTSDELSDLIGRVLADEDRPQPVSLGDLRVVLSRGLAVAELGAKPLSGDQRHALREELDALIEEFGEEAMAESFARAWAGPALSRLIEAGLDAYGEMTLAGVSQAIDSGLLADLVGEGEIDDDEAQTLVAELQSLIVHHGPEALAGGFVRGG